MKRGRSEILRQAAVRSLAILALAVGTAGDAASTQAPVVIGIVSRTQGSWLRRDNPIGPGDRVFLLDTLHADRPESSYVAVVTADDQYVRYECVKVCEAFVPADSMDDGPLLKRVSATVLRLARLFRAIPPRHASGLMRMNAPSAQEQRRARIDGVGDWYETLRRGAAVEAVIRIRGDTVDLAPALATAPSDTYRLQLPMSRGVDRCRAERVGCLPVIHWNASAPLPQRIDSIKPGLYELPNGPLFEASGTFRRTRTSAWILMIQDSVRFAKASAEFDEARTVAASWSRADAADRRTYLRAVLFELALRPDTARAWKQ